MVLCGLGIIIVCELSVIWSEELTASSLAQEFRGLSPHVH